MAVIYIELPPLATAPACNPDIECLSRVCTLCIIRNLSSMHYRVHKVDPRPALPFHDISSI